MTIRNLVAIFALAKLMGLIAALFAFHGSDAPIHLRTAVVHFVCLLTFATFILVANRGRLDWLARAVKPFEDSRGHAWMWWLPISVAAGCMFRIGAEAMYIASASIVSPATGQMEIESLRALYGGAQLPALTWVFVAATAIGAIEEEFVYRGTALWILWDRWGGWWAIVLTTLAFGMMHLNPVAALAGLLLVLLYLLSGRLWVSVLAHLAGNLWHPFASLSGIGGFLVQPSMVVAYLAVGSISLLLFVGFAVYRLCGLRGLHCLPASTRTSREP